MPPEGLQSAVASDTADASPHWPATYSTAGSRRCRRRSSPRASHVPAACWPHTHSRVPPQLFSTRAPRRVRSTAVSERHPSAAAHNRPTRRASESARACEWAKVACASATSTAVRTASSSTVSRSLRRARRPRVSLCSVDAAFSGAAAAVRCSRSCRASSSTCSRDFPAFLRPPRETPFLSTNRSIARKNGAAFQ